MKEVANDSASFFEVYFVQEVRQNATIFFNNFAAKNRVGLP